MQVEAEVVGCREVVEEEDATIVSDLANTVDGLVVFADATEAEVVVAGTVGIVVAVTVVEVEQPPAYYLEDCRSAGLVRRHIRSVVGV